VPKLTETCLLGIDFVTENVIALNGETRRITYKINDKSFSFIADTSTLGNEYSNLIQKLNASVATSTKIKESMSNNVEILQSKIIIDDVNSEMYRNKIDQLLKLNKDVIADKLCELGQAKVIKHNIDTTGKVIYIRPRRQARAHLSVIEKEVNKM
jgi:hypothetical protein